MEKAHRKKDYAIRNTGNGGRNKKRRKEKKKEIKQTSFAPYAKGSSHPKYLFCAQCGHSCGSLVCYHYAWLYRSATIRQVRILFVISQKMGVLLISPCILGRLTT